MKSQIVERANIYVTELLEKGLTPDHIYHTLGHTLSVRDASLELAKNYRLDKEDLELLEIAALFHDTGYTKGYPGHEEVSKGIATVFLKNENFPEEKIEKVMDLIEVTKLGAEPKTLLEKIMKDSDFNTSGGSYLEKSDALRHEWKVFCGNKMNDLEWLKNNLDFWEGHQFYTGEAQALYGEEKRQTLKKLRKKFEKQAPPPTVKKTAKKNWGFPSARAKAPR